MKEWWILLIISLVAVIGISGAISGNLAREPYPYPRIYPITLRGSITDSNGIQLPPGRLVAQVDTYIGQGGVTLQDYVLTLMPGWYEHVDPTFDIYYQPYPLRDQHTYCATIDIQDVFTYYVQYQRTYLASRRPQDLRKLGCNHRVYA